MSVAGPTLPIKARFEVLRSVVSAPIKCRLRCSVKTLARLVLMEKTGLTASRPWYQRTATLCRFMD